MYIISYQYDYKLFYWKVIMKITLTLQDFIVDQISSLIKEVPNPFGEGIKVEFKTSYLLGKYCTLKDIPPPK